MRITNQKDFYAGLIFVFFGALAMLMARNYPMGSAARMGPGYFPTILGGIVSVLGFILLALGLLESGEAINPLVPRPLVLVLGAVLGFALFVDLLGLVLATLVLVVVSCLGGSEFRLREVAILYLVLAALAVGLFVFSLGLPIKVLPL